MERYYYFASTLPLLSLEGKMPFSIEAFLQDCERLMIEEDYVLMKNLLSDEPERIETKNTFYNRWMDNVRKFRNELVFYRATKIHKDPYAHVRGTRYPEPCFMEVIDHAAKTSNPLTAEKMMDYIQWQFLDDMCGRHCFDFEYIMCYGLKLKILERYDHFNSSKGKEFYDQLTQDIMTQSKEKINADL